MTLILTLIFAFLVNYLLLFYELGLGLFLLINGYVAYVCYSLYKKDALSKSVFIKIGITLALIIPYILRDMIVFKLLTFIALPFWLAVFSVDISIHELDTSWKAILISAFRPFTKIHRLIHDLIEKLFKGRDYLKNIVLGILIVIPLLLIIVPLLIGADAIFKDVTISLFDSIEFSGEVLFRILFCLLVASYVYGQAILPLVKHKSIEKLASRIGDESNQEEILDTTTRKKSGTSLTLNTVLLTINTLYSVFVYIQIRYLFLNQGTLPDGVTYATYAREGFFQLLTVAMINVLLVIIIEKFNRHKQGLQRVLEAITLICTLVMSFSAFYRMQLYESEYGYTRLRLLVFLFLIFLILFVGMLLVYIASYKKVIIVIMIIFSGVFYIGTSWFNVDDFVVSKNIERYWETGKFDAYYAVQLSEDAWDRLIEFKKVYPEVFELEFSVNKESSWQSFNFSQYRGGH